MALARILMDDGECKDRSGDRHERIQVSTTTLPTASSLVSPGRLHAVYVYLSLGAKALACKVRHEERPPASTGEKDS